MLIFSLWFILGKPLMIVSVHIGCCVEFLINELFWSFLIFFSNYERHKKQTNSLIDFIRLPRVKIKIFNIVSRSQLRLKSPALWTLFLYCQVIWPILVIQLLPFYYVNILSFLALKKKKLFWSIQLFTLLWYAGCSL